MSPESDDERNDRIREAQIRDRAVGTAKPYAGASARKKAASKESDQPFLVELLGVFFTGGSKDVVKGLLIGIIPAILAAIFLPGVFKFAAVLILAITIGGAYMLGDAPKL